MSKPILILTNTRDEHADVIVERLRECGGNPFRLNLDRFPRDFVVDVSLDRGRWTGTIEGESWARPLSLDRVGAVWTRKPAEFAFADDSMAPQERAFAIAEMRHTLLGLSLSLDCPWMNHPTANRRAGTKIEQLHRASRMGLDVPRSIISARPEAVRAFAETTAEGIIFKPLSSPFLSADEVSESDIVIDGMPTTRVDVRNAALLERVRELPAFFQEYVPKRHELRVTVVGNRTFTARIQSQLDERTATDFRDFSAEVPYDAAELPTDIEQRCLELVHSYGLEYGAIDLIVTPSGGYVFLENNPGGQFMFVEQLVPELQITDAVTQWLITAANPGGLA